MKRLQCLSLVLILCLCMTGCGKKEENAQSEQENADAVEESVGDFMSAVDTSDLGMDEQSVSADQAEQAPPSPTPEPVAQSEPTLTDWADEPEEAARRALARNEEALTGTYGDYLKENFEPGTYYAVITVADGGEVLCIADGEQVSDFYQPAPQTGKCDLYSSLDGDIMRLGTIQSDFAHANFVGIDKYGYLVSEGFDIDDPGRLGEDDAGSYPWSIMEIEVNTTDRCLNIYKYARHSGASEFCYEYGVPDTVSDSIPYQELVSAVEGNQMAGIYFSQLQ